MSRSWTARLSLVAGLAAPVVLLVFGGLASLVLMGVGWVGLALTGAGVWWMLTHTGWIRVLSVLLVVVAPLAVLLLYATAGLLWVVLVSLGLWALAIAAGRAALAEDTAAGMPEHAAVRAERPFLIMNPRSGGGKVEKFRLAERARTWAPRSSYWIRPGGRTWPSWRGRPSRTGPTCSVSRAVTVRRPWWPPWPWSTTSRSW